MSEEGSQRQDGLQGLRIMKSPEGTGASIARLFAPPERRVIKRPVLEAVAQVQRELAEARDEACAIIEEARQEAEALRDQARREGMAEGQQQILEALGRARAEYDRLLAQAEPDMIELAFRVARAILGEELERRPELVAKIVAHQMQHVRGRREVVIAVHPDDEPLLAEHLEALSHLAGGARVYLDGDDDIPRGGCMLQTESGRIDARLDVQLEIIARRLGKGRAP